MAPLCLIHSNINPLFTLITYCITYYYYSFYYLYCCFLIMLMDSNTYYLLIIHLYMYVYVYMYMSTTYYYSLIHHNPPLFITNFHLIIMLYTHYQYLSI